MADPDSEREDDGFFNLSEDLVKLPTIKQAATSEVDFGGLLNPPIKLHEDLAKGCGGQTWLAGMVLARYMLLRHGDSVADKTMSDSSVLCHIHVNSYSVWKLALEEAWSGTKY
jgi:hypothetical protein